MKQFKEGLSYALKYDRVALLFDIIYICFLVIFIIYGFATGQGVDNLWLDLLSIAFAVIGIKRVSSLYNSDPKHVPSARSEISRIIPTDSPWLSMDVVSKVFDLYSGSISFEMSSRNPEKLYVTFENQTHTTIETDTSFDIEALVKKQWRVVQPVKSYPSQWIPVEIPEGHSDEIPFLLQDRYAGLPGGRYRMVKTITANGKTYTLTAEFSLS